MQVQFNADRGVEDHARLQEHAEAAVDSAVGRFGERITRVEVHLNDENSHKSGGDDKRCVIEARLAGLEPLAVSHSAAAWPQAITGAADKLKRVVENTLGRLSQR